MIKPFYFLIPENNFAISHKTKQILKIFKKTKENSSEAEQWFPKPKVRGSTPFSPVIF